MILDCWSVAVVAGAVFFLGLCLVVFSAWRRRRAAQGAELYFPEIDVPQRLGAPFGGGKLAESAPIPEIPSGH